MATRTTRKKLEYQKDCSVNIKCCIRKNELECAGDFNPPLIGTSSEFCKEALAKGVPIQECILSKPETLVLSTEPTFEETLPTHRYLKNWQKWCRVWKKNQEKLTVARNRDTNPPLMACADGKWYRKEDDELFDRTHHSFHLTGYNIKSANNPVGLHPGQKDMDIHETFLPKHFRINPEMKRFRYAKRIRDELGLRNQCPSPTDMPLNGKRKSRISKENIEIGNQFPTGPTGRCYDWEQPWNKSKYFEFAQQINPCDIPDTGYLAPLPYHLILETNADKRKTGCVSPEDVKYLPPNINVPELIFTRESQDINPKKILYEDHRAPVMRVKGCRTEIQLTYDPHVAKTTYYDELPFEQKYFCEEIDLFSVTSRGKDTRHITLTNEGTTAIRYQWLRFPPTKEMLTMLRNPAGFLARGDSFNFNKTTKEDDENIRNAKKEQVHKASSLEFNFRGLPGVLLNGQKLEFPIIFRAQKQGYYHETLYLLTHPQLCDKYGRSYSVKLTGICMDPDLLYTPEAQCRTENVKESLEQAVLERAATEAVNAILDRAVFAENDPPKSTLPLGKVTSESIFYAHNKNLTYHYGTAEKTLELTRKILELLVPKGRLLNNDAVCEISIQSLYRLLWNQGGSPEFYSAHFKTSYTEDLLKKLAEHTSILNQPRKFVYTSKEERIVTACKSSTATLLDEITTAIANVEALYAKFNLRKTDKRKTRTGSAASSGRKNNPDEMNDESRGRETDLDGDDTEAEELEELIETEPTPKSLETPTTPKEKGKKKDKPRSKPQDGDKEKDKDKTEPNSGKKGKKKKGEKEKKETENNRKDNEEEDMHSLPGEDIEEEESPIASTNEGTENRSASGSAHSSDTPLSVPRSEPDEASDNRIDDKTIRISQAKRILLGDILGSAIDRIVCVVDAMKAVEDYKTSKFIVPTYYDSNYCCDRV